MVASSSDAAARESLLMHGVLDMCVLALLGEEPMHAYGVVEQLQAHGFDNASYGTIYPLTTRLRKSGLVDQELIPSAAGPARNILTLNQRGRTALDDWVRQWEATTAKATALISGRKGSTTRNRTDVI